MPNRNFKAKDITVNKHYCDLEILKLKDDK